MDRPIDKNFIFLVSGGGRGITAQCVIKLAQRKKCKFILLGRSEIANSEPVWAQDCFDELQLKKRIMEYLLTLGEKPTPKVVKQKFKSIVARREIQQTISSIENAGGQARYLSVDVTDSNALQKEVASAVNDLGQINGIIHGAGNLSDKLVEQKTTQDFEIVYAPKVKGLINLLDCVDSSYLNYLVLFSSVAGFYGNAGQTDYALANEILNKSAHLYQSKHPNCRVVAINWGPWDSGMVSPQLKKVFAERNIETIPVEAGTEMLVRELESVKSRDAQVIIGSLLTPFPRRLTPELCSHRISRRLSLDANPFLQDHAIAGKPVLPATCAVAWTINICEQLYPGYSFFSCQNFKVLKGIIFESNLVKEYNLDIQEVAKPDNNTIELEVKVFSLNSQQKRLYHFSIRLKLQHKKPVAPVVRSLEVTEENPVYSDPSSLYQNGELSFFHGVSFQGIKAILNADLSGITVQCNLARLKLENQGQFPVQTYNPYIGDTQLHPLWIWSQKFLNNGCLPSAIVKYEQFIPLEFDRDFYITCKIKSKTATSIIADIFAHDSQGKIYNQMLEAKGVILPVKLAQKS